MSGVRGKRKDSKSGAPISRDGGADRFSFAFRFFSPMALPLLRHATLDAEAPAPRAPERLMPVLRRAPMPPLPAAATRQRH